MDEQQSTNSNGQKWTGSNGRTQNRAGHGHETAMDEQQWTNTKSGTGTRTGTGTKGTIETSIEDRGAVWI